MRRILCMMLLFVLLGAGGARAAAWTDDFVVDYDEFGISVAVENALHNDVTPDEILTFIISNSEKFETKKGLKALYCAGADRDAVREAGNKLGITVEDVSAALEESIAECGDKKSLSDRDFLGEGPENISGLSDREPEPQPASEPQSAPEQIDDEPEGVTLSEQVAPPEKALPASPSAP